MFADRVLRVMTNVYYLLRIVRNVCCACQCVLRVVTHVCCLMCMEGNGTDKCLLTVFRG